MRLTGCQELRGLPACARGPVCPMEMDVATDPCRLVVGVGVEGA